MLLWQAVMRMLKMALTFMRHSMRAESQARQAALTCYILAPEERSGGIRLIAAMKMSAG